MNSNTLLARRPAAGRSSASWARAISRSCSNPSAGLTTVRITTSIDGDGKVWQAQLDRVFKGASVGPGGPAVALEINDFGATPGVVGMRIAQAFGAVGAGAGATS